MADFQILKNNIIDMLEEQQQKLGYQRETVRLYYPLESLNHLLGTSANREQMRDLLREFRDSAPELGPLRFSDREERFCVTVPPEGTEYVFRSVPENQFLKGLLRLVSRHGCTLNEVRDYFRRSADCVTECRMAEEFDLLLYFPDGKPDTYRYCLKEEGSHVLYHRFTEADFLSLGLREADEAVPCSQSSQNTLEASDRKDPDSRFREMHR